MLSSNSAIPSSSATTASLVSAQDEESISSTQIINNANCLNGEQAGELEQEKDEEKTQQDDNEKPRVERVVPNGGLNAWLQVSGSFFLFMNGWGISNTFGVYQNYYVQVNLSNKNASDIAWIGSIQGFLLLLVGAITGPVFDQGHFRLLVVLGSFLVVFGMMMTSLGTEYYQVMLSQAIVLGLGSGCLFIPSVAIMPQYFTTKRSLATGLAASGSSLGGVIYPIIFHKLQPRIGFGWATRVIAFIMLATQLYALAVMRSKTVPSTARKLIDETAFRDLPFLAFAFVVFFGFIGVYIPFYYIQSFAVTKHIFSAADAFWLLPILNAASIFGRILPNFCADKVGAVNVLGTCTIATVTIAGAWLAAKTPAGLVLIAVFYGFFSGSFVSLPPSVMVSLSPDMKLIGTRMGMIFSFCALGLLIGTPIAGALLKSPATYTATVAFCLATVAMAGLFVFLTRTLRVGWTLKIKI